MTTSKLSISVSSTNPNVYINNGKTVTTSKDVADYFDKRHERVLDKIRNLDCSKEFTEHNFVLSEYVDSTGRKLPMYEMTKNGFIFLVMGFTGKKAAAFKEAYIAEFDRMEAQLHNAVTVTGNTSKILLTLLPNGKVDSAQVVRDNEYVASLDTLFEIGRRAGYVMLHKDELIKKLSE